MRDDRGAALREIGTLFGAGTFAGLGDGALLDRFVSAHGEAAEAAFATLVERHGPMVLRVCKRVLKDHNDAEDAFQATFLALLRGAATIRKRESVASWLHGTALRVSAFARSSGLRRKAREGRSAELRLWERADPACDDLRAAIVEEVGRLPDRYRMAVVLCDLEGLSHRDAAESLGWPVGTIKSRVTRGRERLKSRLIRRGLAPAVGLIGAFGKESVAVVGPKLAKATVALAIGQRTAGVLSSAMTLASLYQRSLIMSRIRTVIGIAAFGVFATGATLLAQGKGGAGQPGGAVGTVRGDTYVKSYVVSDLIIDFNARRVPSDLPIPIQVDMTALIELISSTVAPGTWRVTNEAGGDPPAADPDDRKAIGTIIPFHLSMSLIVRHTAEVHTQVAERLEMLRHLIKVRETNGERLQGSPVPKTPTVVPGGAVPNVEVEMLPWFMIDSPTPQTDSQATKAKRAALRLLYEGTTAYKAADFAKAEKSIGAGLSLLKTFTTEHPAANVDYPSQDELTQILKRYANARKQLGLPVPPDTPYINLGHDGSVEGIKSLLNGGAVPPPSGGMMGSAGAPGGASMMPGAGGGAGMMMGMQGMMGSSSSASPGTETERRLRAVEEKLDRLLKVLDKPKSD
jgi:RNA polymerase sigma factor (sigma-70 family)